MFLHILATAFLLGLLLMLSILNLMRSLYGCGIGEPPTFDPDPMNSPGTDSPAMVVPAQRTEST
jgi:hypothetical protein